MLSRFVPDILSYIMILAQESMRFDDDGDGIGGGHDLDMDLSTQQPFEITISQVNSSIRSTALLTARLWSSIRIDTGAQNANIILERITAYLARSRGHLLDVRIELNEISRPNDYLLHQAMEMIAKESQRWRKLAIVAEEDGIMGVTLGIRARLIKDGKKDWTPELEFLSISVDYSELGYARIGEADNGGGLQIARVEAPPSNAQGMHFHPAPNNVNATSTAFQRVGFGLLPKLSFLRLRGLAVFLFQPTLLLRLQTLHLDQTKAIPLSFPFLSSVTAACPVLEHLSIYGDIAIPSWPGGDTDQQAPDTGLGGGQSQVLSHQTGNEETESRSKAKQAGDSIICLPELRSLRMCGTRGTVPTILLSRLEAPKLRSFSVKDVQEHDLESLWDDPLATSLIASSGKGVHRGSQGHPAQASRFTQLRSLTLNNSNLSQSVYQRLFQTFPGIVDFASYSSVEVDKAPMLLVEGAAGVPWPHLRTLTFVFDVDLYADDEMLEELLKQRRKLGHPVDKVRIGVAELDPEEEEETEEQRTLIVMERLDGIDTWPLNRQYLDIDDILF